MSETQVQITAAKSPQPSRKWWARRFCNTKWRGGAPFQLSATRLPTRWTKEQGGWAYLRATRVFGQRMKVVDERDELARRFIIRASAREALERTCCFRGDQESPAKENVRARYSFFLLQALPRQTTGRAAPCSPRSTRLQRGCDIPAGALATGGSSDSTTKGTRRAATR